MTVEQKVEQVLDGARTAWLARNMPRACESKLCGEGWSEQEARDVVEKLRRTAWHEKLEQA